jgi:hypothetical protein
MKPMIYTVQYIMLLMRADALRGQVGGRGALEIDTFLGPVKWHRGVRRMPFGPQKRLDFHVPPLPMALRNGFSHIIIIRHAPYKQQVVAH